MGGDVDAQIAKRKGFMIMHMNLDHADSLKAYVHYYAKVADAARVLLVDLDAAGMTLAAELEDKSWRTGIVVPFPEPLESARAVRKVVVAMHKEAYAGLGWTPPEQTAGGVVGHLVGHMSTAMKLAATATAVLSAAALLNRFIKIELR